MQKNIFSLNKKACYNYEILEKLEVGIILHGYEVKSIRHSSVSLVEGVVKFYNREAFIENMFVALYKHTSCVYKYNPVRKRKLLMHRSEINKMYTKAKVKGLSVIPLEIYNGSNSKVKLLIGLVRGKKMYDKRGIIKNRDIARETAREY
ncbi:MAG: SsrA-binding protein SmpB [Endomicrobium sp.]|jgi:SsrA-binding protein|nr:SsrA-binding protein SmpB [Endomicrobium sp.]